MFDFDVCNIFLVLLGATDSISLTRVAQYIIGVLSMLHEVSMISWSPRLCVRAYVPAFEIIVGFFVLPSMRVVRSRDVERCFVLFVFCVIGDALRFHVRRKMKKRRNTPASSAQVTLQGWTCLQRRQCAHDAHGF